MYLQWRLYSIQLTFVTNYCSAVWSWQMGNLIWLASAGITFVVAILESAGPCAAQQGWGTGRQLLFLCWIPDYGHFWLIRPWDAEWVWGERFHPSFTVQRCCILSIVQSIRMVSVAKFCLRTEGCGQDDVNLQAQIWNPSFFFRETQFCILAVLSPWG